MCCGCSACAAICPEHNIQMQSDEEGFFFSVITDSKCLNCGLCIKVCPIADVKKTNEYQERSSKYYVGVNKDYNVWNDSASGGAFDAICRSFGIDAVIFGARWEMFDVVMDYCDGIEGVSPFHKSKYVAANPLNTYQETKQQLLNGHKVLYSGTPCQINGLKKYLSKDFDNLLLVDFACHGQGSPMVFKKWVEKIESKYKKKLVMFQFREKKFIKDHLNSNCCKYVFEDGCETVVTRDRYHHAYVNGICMRESCMNCNFAHSRSSDITLADYKNMKAGLPYADPRKNLSTLIANTPKGVKYIERMTEFIFYEADSDFINSFNPKLIKGIPGNTDRKAFMNKIRKTQSSVDKLFKLYAPISLTQYLEYNYSNRLFRRFASLTGFIDKICFRINCVRKNNDRG